MLHRLVREVMTIGSTSLPLSLGSTGPAVRDLTARLRGAGFDPGADTVAFGDATEAALQRFQASRGLEPAGVCDRDTWLALVEAGYSVGDRLLYLTSPMLRGDDVAELQLQLGALGFDAGRVDGIFGPTTRAALLEFQQNMGLVTDEVCGPETVATLARLQPRGGTTSVAGVRERHRLRTRHPALTQRVALAHLGEAEALLGAIGVELRGAGASVAVLGGSDWSELANRINTFDADIALAVSVGEGTGCEAAYFETTGFHSVGGSHLAHLVADELPSNPKWPLITVIGKRAPILRETRAPAVALRMGPLDQVIQQRHLVATALARAITRWSVEPC
jgi:N-acetylmuramoyl-L-alanine amidase